MKNQLLLIKSIVLIACCMLPTLLMAQRPVRHFLMNDGSEAKSRSKADFVREFRPPGNSGGLWSLTEYYPDRQVKRKGSVREVARRPSFHGLVESYYKDGQVKSQVRYRQGKRVGSASYFYPNGQLHREMIYARRAGADAEEFVPDTMVQYFDSLGTALVSNGTGFVREVSANGKDYEEGTYAKGIRDGAWTGTHRNGKYTFAEQYDRGKLVSGVTTDRDGKTYAYSTLRVAPIYNRGAKNGIDNFRREINHLYRYPREAIIAQVRGLVAIRFVIDEEGNMVDHTIEEDQGYGTGEAGIDAIKSINKRWVPGLQRGVPIKVSYTLPIRLAVQ